MTRYLKLYLYFVQFSVSRSLEFRVDFFFRVFMDTIYYVVQILFFKIIFLNTSILGGWREDQVMVFVAAYLMVDAIQMTLFANNVWWISNLINKGDLDYYLVRPVSSMFFICTRDFATNSFLNFLMTIGICIWALSNYSGEISPPNLILYFFCIFCGAVLHFALHFIFVIPVFWTHSNRGFVQVYWPLTKFMERPDSIFRGWTKKILVTILPFSLMASFPARVIWDQHPLALTGYVVLGTFLFLFIGTQLWNLGLKSYSSASS